MLEIIGLDRTKVYVANIVKCRPPRNRDPLNVEQDACSAGSGGDGAAAAQADCLSGPDRRQGYHQGRLQDHRRAWEVFQRGGVQMTAIYHPSALLRDVEKRPETFVDLKAIQAKVREICTHTDC